MVLQTCVDLRVRLASPEESFLQTKPKGLANQMKDLDECILLVRVVLTSIEEIPITYENTAARFYANKSTVNGEDLVEAKHKIHVIEIT